MYWWPLQKYHLTDFPEKSIKAIFKQQRNFTSPLFPRLISG